ncbi:MAG TPA: hypothetical protein VGA98_00400 [Allosphingosinicella sp.]|jgi:hypothetical protein
MAVVINEFEAVAEPPQARGSDGAAGASEAANRIMPRDIRPALILLAGRRSRLRSH